MKKLAISLVAVVAALIMCFAMAACAPVDVAGKTFVFDKMEVSYSGDVDAATKAIYDEVVKAANEAPAEVKDAMAIEFKEDGTCTMGYYKQDGSKLEIYMTNPADDDKAEPVATLTVSGSTIVAEETEDGVTLKTIYKQK